MTYIPFLRILSLVTVVTKPRHGYQQALFADFNYTDITGVQFALRLNNGGVMTLTPTEDTFVDNQMYQLVIGASKNTQVIIRYVECWD